MPDSAPRRHVIVGASAAGTAAAHALRSEGFDGEVVLLDADTRLPYERPPLSKSTGLDDRDLPIYPASSYVDHDITLRLGTRATALLADERRVVLQDGSSLVCETVLLATGVTARRLPVPGADLENVLQLRDADDAVRLHSRLAAEGPLVIVGGGFIGLEIAAVARAQGVDVTVVEVSDRPLSGALGEHHAALLLARHRDEGVVFELGATVRRLVGGPAVSGVELTDLRVLPAATVLVAIGTECPTDLSEQAGVHFDRGIVVDASCRTNLPWVLAAGDVANAPLPGGGRARTEHWQTAIEHGTVAGATMAGATVQLQHVPYFWTEQYDLLTQVYGTHRADDDMVRRPGAGGDIAFWLREDRLVAAAGIGLARDLRSVRPLIATAAPVLPGDLADPTVRLRDLARGREQETVGGAAAPATLASCVSDGAR